MSEDQDVSEEGFIVPAPFDSLSPGDCILKSIEGTEFKALRQILVLASQVMADMFGLPQGEAHKVPHEGTPDHLPVIPMQEDAETIHNLLVLLYPTSVPKELGVQAAIKLAKTYDKYLIPKDRLRLSVGLLYNSESTLKTSPIELYRLAWELEMMLEAKIASRYTHKIPFEQLHATLPLKPLEELLNLRRRREEALDSLIAAVEPRSTLCDTHTTNDGKFFRQIAALKEKARQSIQVPYPEKGARASSFFGQRRGYPPTRDGWKSWSRNNRNFCGCFEDCDWDSMSSVLASALQEFPQCI
ncbi:hypothetical protein M407DRAFT_25793 [Tulasnella calospora MUT 4182]|uniref:BTB domain-containing protein n=1 Tax=Tulasnella calospora MUT 4182 TaxID=1051891 RepID=A0A0C3LU11_9AGAM|nr:hypothetical protein M407DRAFT_25793 [Tulasnella calospora MUT 4182]